MGGGGGGGESGWGGGHFFGGGGDWGVGLGVRVAVNGEVKLL